MKQAFIALAASYFVNYPAENTIFFTTDKQAFFLENDAFNHGKSLRKKESDEPEVIAVTRNEAYAEITGEERVTAPATAIVALTKDQALANLSKATGAEAIAKKDWDEKAAQLATATENKNFQKWEASAKAKYEKAAQDLADAQAALNTFTEAEKN